MPNSFFKKAGSFLTSKNYKKRKELEAALKSAACEKNASVLVAAVGALVDYMLQCKRVPSSLLDAGIEATQALYESGGNHKLAITSFKEISFFAHPQSDQGVCVAQGFVAGIVALSDEDEVLSSLLRGALQKNTGSDLKLHAAAEYVTIVGGCSDLKERYDKLRVAFDLATKGSVLSLLSAAKLDEERDRAPPREAWTPQRSLMPAFDV